MSAPAKSIEELRSVADDISRSLGDLSAEQLNWKPGEKRWSVAQCLDHLITTHQLYFPLFEKLSADEARPSFWEKASPLSGFFGRFLIRSLDPKNTKKMKTTAKAFPSSSAIDGDIVDRFCRHQTELIGHIRAIRSDLNPSNTIVTSPLLGFVTYTLEDALIFLPMHCERHLGQAKEVGRAAGFPVTLR